MRSHRGMLLGLLMLLTVSGCGGKGETEWVDHADPAGFTMRLPKGWQTTVARAGGSVAIRATDPDSGAFVAICPVKPTRRSAEAVLREAPATLGEVFPEAQLAAVETTADGARARMTFTVEGTSFRASLLCVKRGRAGMLYAVAAPDDAFDAQRETLLTVLESFAFGAPATTPEGGAAAPDVVFVKWTDPKENAFTLDVPKGWKVTGGLFRHSATEPRASVGVESPDATRTIIIGDASHPTCTEPGFSAHFPEGSWYSPGYGVKMLVKTYRTGKQYAQEFVARAVEGDFSGLRFVRTRDLPQEVAAVNRVYAQNGSALVNTSVSMGDAAFTCMKGEQAMSGYCIAMTMRTQSQAMGLWHVEFLAGCLAPGPQAPQTQAVAEHMVRSYRLNPDWVRMQRNLTGNVSKIVADTNNEIGNIINRGYQGRQAVQDDIARKRSNAILGLTDLVDAETGETYKVSSGSNYYWTRQGADVVAGTETADAPGVDFTPLREW